jgi:putative transposase
VVEHQKPERLYSEIGKLKMELDWLKKVWVLPAMTRRAWIELEGGLPGVRQCLLAGVLRATVDVHSHPVEAGD